MEEELFEIYKLAPWLAAPQYISGLENLLAECNALHGKSEDAKALVLDLVNRLRYVKSADVMVHAANMAAKIENDWGLMPSNSVIAAIHDGWEPDASQSIISSMRQYFKSRWESKKNNRLFSNFQPVFDEIRAGAGNIVIVDDFIGTGDKVTKKIDSIKNWAKGNGLTCKIFCIALAGMSLGVKKVEAAIGPDSVWCEIIMSKGIADHYQGENLRKNTELMMELESRFLDPVTLWVDKSKPAPIYYNFGYKGSETIFSLEAHRVPNNVFPVFWWDVYFDEDYFLGKKRKMRRRNDRLRSTIFRR